MRTRICVSVLACLIAGACGGPKTGPSSLVSITVSGPTSVAPGTLAKFTAVGHYSDGTTQDYSTAATWRADNSAVLAANAGGSVTGRTPGETVLSANFASISGSALVFVLNAGTYRLTGVVTADGAPLSGATVSIVAGIGTGLKTITDGGGNYRLYGVSGLVQLEVSRSGYAPFIQALTVSSNQTTADVTLAATSGVPDLSALVGTYSMQVTAAQPCSYASGTLPDALKTRTYTAALTVNGTSVLVTLSGANFLLSGGHGASFTALGTPTGLNFRIGDGYYYSAYPDLLESLTPDSALIIDGYGTLELSGTTLLGFINGQYAITGLPFPQSPFVTICYSPAHRIVLTRTSPSSARARR